jgi:hypothetical protein
MVALLWLSLSAFAQDVGSTMWLATDVEARRFPDTDAKGPAFETGDEVTVLFVEGALVRVTTGDRFGWVAPTALTATDPTPDAAPTGPTREFSMEDLQELLDRTKTP